MPVLRIRRHVALIAAYAVALQALLSAFVIPAAVTGAGAILVICGAGAADPSGAPALPPDHGTCPACLAGHCAVGCGGERAASLVSWPRVAALLQVPAARTIPVAPVRREQPHGPRAPPLA